MVQGFIFNLRSKKTGKIEISFLNSFDNKMYRDQLSFTSNV